MFIYLFSLVVIFHWSVILWKRLSRLHAGSWYARCSPFAVRHLFFPLRSTLYAGTLDSGTLEHWNSGTLRLSVKH